MVSLVIDCPHCPAKNSGFSYQSEHKGMRRYQHAKAAVFICNVCGGTVIVECLNPGSNHLKDLTGNILHQQNMVISNIYPKRAPIDAPDHLPDDIRSRFLDAKHNLQEERWEAAALMGRRVLETAAKKIAANNNIAVADKEELTSIINTLHHNGLITNDLKEWAHIFRNEGNIANHNPGEYSEKKTRELIDFTEMFLIYTFQLPEMIKLRKQPPNGCTNPR